jgi:hypothetical protein
MAASKVAERKERVEICFTRTLTPAFIVRKGLIVQSLSKAITTIQNRDSQKCPADHIELNDVLFHVKYAYTNRIN